MINFIYKLLGKNYRVYCIFHRGARHIGIARDKKDLDLVGFGYRYSDGYGKEISYSLPASPERVVWGPYCTLKQAVNFKKLLKRKGVIHA